MSEQAPRPYPESAASGAPRSRSDAAREFARSAEAPLGTGHGRRETSYAQHVPFERATSGPAEVVTLYYDSYANLLARGVIRQPVPYTPSPRPFPGFVPDPYS